MEKWGQRSNWIGLEEGQAYLAWCAEQPRADQPRGVRWDHLALGLVALLILAVLASSIAATDRRGIDPVIPQELR